MLASVGVTLPLQPCTSPSVAHTPCSDITLLFDIDYFISKSAYPIIPLLSSPHPERTPNLPCCHSCTWQMLHPGPGTERQPETKQGRQFLEACCPLNPLPLLPH